MNKQIEEIINNPGQFQIIQIVEKEVRVSRSKYLHAIQVNYGKEEHVLIPYTTGSTASALPWDSYEYTHGGKVFRAAVEKCHEYHNK